MNSKTLKCGFSIPTIGLGTWLMGGGTEADNSNDEQAIAAIKEAISLGYAHIDTAEMYGAGHTEELIAKAIKDVDRSTLFITSKVHRRNLRYDDVIASVKASLKRLETDYLDLYLIHAPNLEVPLTETMRAMNELVDQGLVKHIGVSNFTVDLLKEAQKHSKHKIVANQIEYSLLTRNKGRYSGNIGMEEQTIPYCQEQDIIIVAERPIERGVLLKDHPLLNELCTKYNKTKAQIAINWLISKKNIVTIPKSTSRKHLLDNLGALGWNLSDEDMKRLDQTSFHSLL